MCITGIMIYHEAKFLFKWESVKSDKLCASKIQKKTGKHWIDTLISNRRNQKEESGTESKENLWIFILKSNPLWFHILPSRSTCMAVSHLCVYMGGGSMAIGPYTYTFVSYQSTRLSFQSTCHSRITIHICGYI